MRQSDADFRQLAASVPQFVWVTSAAVGSLLYVSEQWSDYPV